MSYQRLYENYVWLLERYKKNRGDWTLSMLMKTKSALLELEKEISIKTRSIGNYK